MSTQPSLRLRRVTVGTFCRLVRYIFAALAAAAREGSFGLAFRLACLTIALRHLPTRVALLPIRLSWPNGAYSLARAFGGERVSPDLGTSGLPTNDVHVGDRSSGALSPQQATAVGVSLSMCLAIGHCEQLRRLRGPRPQAFARSVRVGLQDGDRLRARSRNRGVRVPARGKHSSFRWRPLRAARGCRGYGRVRARAACPSAAA